MKGIATESRRHGGDTEWREWEGEVLGRRGVEVGGRERSGTTDEHG
jgi:hypothetical protein